MKQSSTRRDNALQEFGTQSLVWNDGDLNKWWWKVIRYLETQTQSSQNDLTLRVESWECCAMVGSLPFGVLMVAMWQWWLSYYPYFRDCVCCLIFTTIPSLCRKSAYWDSRVSCHFLYWCIPVVIVILCFQGVLLSLMIPQMNGTL